MNVCFTKLFRNSGQLIVPVQSEWTLDTLLYLPTLPGRSALYFSHLSVPHSPSAAMPDFSQMPCSRQSDKWQPVCNFKQNAFFPPPYRHERSLRTEGICFYESK